jgi:hypothetical protein
LKKACVWNVWFAKQVSADDEITSLTEPGAKSTGRAGDGLEFEGADVAPDAFCQGTYKQAPDGSYHDYHIAWTFDNTGRVNGYWDETMVVTVGADGQSYSGTYTRDFYDLNGNFLFEDDGTTTATRLIVERIDRPMRQRR